MWKQWVNRFYDWIVGRFLDFVAAWVFGSGTVVSLVGILWTYFSGKGQIWTYFFGGFLASSAIGGLALLIQAKRIPSPNIVCRRVFHGELWVGQPGSGTIYRAIIVEIANDPSGRKVGTAENVRVFIKYLNEGQQVLHTYSPAYCGYGYNKETITLQSGEAEVVGIAVMKNHEWFSSLWGNPTILINCNVIKIKIIDGYGRAISKPIHVAFKYPSEGVMPSFNIFPD